MVLLKKLNNITVNPMENLWIRLKEKVGKKSLLVIYTVVMTYFCKNFCADKAHTYIKRADIKSEVRKENLYRIWRNEGTNHEIFVQVKAMRT